MNKVRQVVPKIRFLEFNEKWSKKQINDLVTPITREVDKPDKPYKRISIRSHAKGTFQQEVNDPKTIAMDKLYVVKTNDLIVNITFAWEHAIAVAKNEDDGLLVSHRFPTFLIDKSDINFISYLVSQENFRRKLDLISPGGAGRNRVLNKKDFIKLQINVPIDIKEQAKIGSFFKQLDEMIDLQQQCLDDYKQLKKVMLQKMFPKNNDKIPEIRFDEYTDTWELRKLGDESEILAGGDINKTKLKKFGKYPVFANALTNKGIVGYYDDYYRVEAPAVTVTGRGDVGHAKARKTNFTPVVRLLSVCSKHDVDFLENVINNHHVFVESTGVPQLTSPQLGNYKIFFPNIEEQQKIGNFFKQLDNTIALHQSKLNSYKDFKKAMLQRMFI